MPALVHGGGPASPAAAVAAAADSNPMAITRKGTTGMHHDTIVGFSEPGLRLKDINYNWIDAKRNAQAAAGFCCKDWAYTIRSIVYVGKFLSSNQKICGALFSSSPSSRELILA